MHNIILNDRYLRMGAAERVMTRIIIATAFMLSVVAAAVFLFSDSAQIKYAGILLIIFFIDKIIHRGQARKSLKKLKDKGSVNLADYLTPKAADILAFSVQAARLSSADLGLEIASRAIELKDIRRAITRLGISPNELEQKIKDGLKAHEGVKRDPNRDIEEIAVAAYETALVNGEAGIMPADLFVALGSSGGDKVRNMLGVFDIDPQDLNKALIFERLTGTFKKTTRLPKTTAGFAAKFFGRRKHAMNRAWTAKPTPTLDMFGWDVTDMANAGQAGFLVGHAREYETMIDILSRPTRPNLILVGEPGIGKETIIGHLAYRMANDEVPRTLFDKRLVALNISALVSGADQPELQKRINAIFQEIKAAGNVVLYIPEIHNLSRTSGELYLSAANIMLPLIVDDDFPTIGTTYPQEFKKFIERDTAFMGAFEAVRVEELTEGEAEQYLVYESILLEKEWKMTIAFEAVKRAVYLAKKYFHQKPLPSSADDLLKEALSEAKRKGDNILLGGHVVSAAERKINIPIHQAGPDEAKALLGLEDEIHKRLIDQKEAVSAVARALREYRSGLSRQGGPIAAFLFVGPTGVGKTELAKALARIQFGSEEMMIRLDMSEYQEKEGISRLIGSADGRIYGTLSESVLEKPYSLVLLDEFEKAHPDILNLFLQVMDDGRLTDASGRFVDFQNTIIIATSNAQSDFIKSSLEKGTKIEAIATEIKRKLTEQFRPELLNRFSDIIVFKTLSEEDILAITKLQLKSLSGLLMENQGIEITFDDGAVALVAKTGYDPVFGARPLRNAISKLLKDPLSAKILSGDVSRGEKVAVSAEGEELKFSEY